MIRDRRRAGYCRSRRILELRRRYGRRNLIQEAFELPRPDGVLEFADRFGLKRYRYRRSPSGHPPTADRSQSQSIGWIGRSFRATTNMIALRLRS